MISSAPRGSGSVRCAGAAPMTRRPLEVRGIFPRQARDYRTPTRPRAPAAIAFCYRLSSARPTRRCRTSKQQRSIAIPAMKRPLPPQAKRRTMTERHAIEAARARLESDQQAAAHAAVRTIAERDAAKLAAQRIEAEQQADAAAQQRIASEKQALESATLRQQAERELLRTAQTRVDVETEALRVAAARLAAEQQAEAGAQLRAATETQALEAARQRQRVEQESQQAAQMRADAETEAQRVAAARRTAEQQAEAAALETERQAAAQAAARAAAERDAAQLAAQRTEAEQLAQAAGKWLPRPRAAALSAVMFVIGIAIGAWISVKEPATPAVTTRDTGNQVMTVGADGLRLRLDNNLGSLGQHPVPAARKTAQARDNRPAHTAHQPGFLAGNYSRDNASVILSIR